MLSLLPSAVVLGCAALAALLLAWGRPASEDVGERRSAARALLLAAGVQGVHFVEEAVTGFPEQLGTQLGLPAMSYAFFVVFNVLWLGVWIASVPGVQSGRTWALIAAWFLAIAGVFNGVAHPLLAVAAGGYFPGVVTSPAVAVAGGWLFFRLRRATR